MENLCSGKRKKKTFRHKKAQKRPNWRLLSDVAYLNRLHTDHMILTMSQSGKKEAMVTVKGLGATRHGGMRGLRQSTGHTEHCEPILYNAVMVDTITACLLKSPKEMHQVQMFMQTMDFS